ncbi:hypothetical protein MMC12_005225 [Toensbergia leucococca]|nr:hypothetical protein [Toensbergia leucococca]
MFLPLLTFVLCISFAPTGRAFNDIETNSTATASLPFGVHIDNDLSTSNSFDAGFDSYRVYLAITVPGWGSGPSCTLVSSSSISTTDFTVTIPATVGPSGSYYSISTIEMNSDPSRDRPSGFQYSDGFNFTGGAGQWSQYELSGHSIGDADSIPCTAYDYDVGDSESANDNAYNCMLQCPGVTPEPSDGDDSGNSSATAAASSSSLSQANSLAVATSMASSSSTTSAVGASSPTSSSPGSSSPTTSSRATASSASFSSTKGTTSSTSSASHISATASTVASAAAIYPSSISMLAAAGALIVMSLPSLMIEVIPFSFDWRSHLYLANRNLGI